MEFKEILNRKCQQTSVKMIGKGFHEDDDFMVEIGMLLPMDKVVKFAETWVRNRKLARIALIHSELSEMVEGIRKESMDDKLPHRKQEEVELADTLIRMEDYAGTYGLDLGGARDEKEAYNDGREYKHGKLV